MTRIGSGVFASENKMTEKIGRITIDKHLMNPKFEGYKILTDAVEIKAVALQEMVFEKYSPLRQSDFLSSKMNMFNNSLHYDQKYLYYFSEEDCKLMRLNYTYKCESNSLLQLGKTTRLFPPSIHFLGDEKVIFDGLNVIILYNENWAEITRFCVGSSLVPKFVYSAFKHGPRLSVAIGSLTTIEKDTKTRSVCSIQIYNIFIETGHVEEREITFTDFPSAFQLITEQHAITVVESGYKDLLEIPQKSSQDIFFTWSQDSESIDIEFEFEKLDIVFEPSKIKIFFDHINIDHYEFKFSDVIDADSSKWVLNGKTIDFTIIKKTQGFWLDLFSNNKNGFHLIGPDEEEFNKELVQGLNRYTSSDNEYISAHLSTHYDEDLVDNDEFADYYCNLYNINDKHPLEEINLLTRKILSVKFDRNSNIMKIYFQRDVDAIGISAYPSTDFSLETRHHHTFHALAYVYLSKKDARFTFTSDDDRYFYIVDSKGYVFIYECFGNGNTAIQRIAEIKALPLGAALVGHVLYVLTKDCLYKIKIVK